MTHERKERKKEEKTKQEENKETLPRIESGCVALVLNLRVPGLSRRESIVVHGLVVCVSVYEYVSQCEIY